jgi:mutator protein MutT
MTGSADKPRCQVAAALIRRADGRLLIARRPAGAHLAGLWEFPGGKQEPGEDLETCLRREIREELGIEILVGPTVFGAEHEYESKIVALRVFACRMLDGEPSALEGQEIRWVRSDDLSGYEFPAADRRLVRILQSAAGGLRRKGVRSRPSR